MKEMSGKRRENNRESELKTVASVLFIRLQANAMKLTERKASTPLSRGKLKRVLMN